MLMYHDVATLNRDMVSRDADLQAALYARMVLLTIHESCLTLRGLLGRDFQDEARNAFGDEAVAAVRSAHSSLNAVFELANREFGDVRNGLGAHRDPDAHVRWRLLKKGSPHTVANIVIAFLTANVTLLGTLDVYFSRIGAADAA